MAAPTGLSTLRGMSLPATRPAAEASRWHRSGNRRLAGLLGVVFGTGWFLQESRLFGWTPGWDLVLAAVLITLGGGLLATARAPRRVWPFVLGAVLAVSLTGDDVSVRSIARATGGEAVDRFGGADARDTSVVVDRAEDLAGEYRQALGTIDLDLHRLALAPGRREVRISLGAGDVRVRVPREYPVEVQARVGTGSLEYFGTRIEGVGLTRRFTNRVPVSRPPTTGFSDLAGQPDQAVLVLEIEVGAGEVQIT